MRSRPCAASLDVRFRKSEFEHEYAGDALPWLSDALTDEVQRELHGAILDKVREIVGRLNGLGHNLAEYYPPEPGDISFRDGIGDDNRCDLRLAVDVVVSIGFRDTVSADELLGEFGYEDEK